MVAFVFDKMLYVVSVETTLGLGFRSTIYRGCMLMISSEPLEEQDNTISPNAVSGYK